MKGVLLVIYLLSSWLGFILASKSPSLSPRQTKYINLVKSKQQQQGKCDKTKEEEEEFRPIQIMCEINGFSISAIIDTGAQVSIMSSSCAKRCHLFNSIDRHFAGKAQGVGSGEILGRIDQMMMRMGPLTFKSRIFVLRDSPVDFLIGLDFLKRFEGEISLKDNVLRLNVKGKFLRIPFLSENVSMYSQSSESSHSSDEQDSLDRKYDSVVYESTIRETGVSDETTMNGQYSPSPHPESSLSAEEGAVSEEDLHNRKGILTAAQVSSPLTDMYGEVIEEFIGDSISMEGV